MAGAQGMVAAGVGRRGEEIDWPGAEPTLRPAMVQRVMSRPWSLCPRADVFTFRAISRRRDRATKLRAASLAGLRSPALSHGHLPSTRPRKTRHSDRRLVLRHRDHVELPRFGGRGTASGSSGGLGPPFVLDGRGIAERRMAAPRVGPALDEGEDRPARLGLGMEAPAVEQLTLRRGEEALARRVVVGVADRAGRTPASRHRAAKASEVYRAP